MIDQWFKLICGDKFHLLHISLHTKTAHNWPPQNGIRCVSEKSQTAYVCMIHSASWLFRFLASHHF